MRIKKHIFVGVVAAGVAASLSAAELVSLNGEWDFHLGDDIKVSWGKTGLDEYGGDNGNSRLRRMTNGMEKVTVPHDWALTLPFTDDCEGSREGRKAIGWAFKPNSVAWYRKFFSVPDGFDGKRISVRFEGVYRDAKFWMNGVYLGCNESGYAECEFDVTDALYYGRDDNMLSVRVDATANEGWWYEGAGIYRPVWLVVRPDMHLAPRSNYFRTVRLADGAAMVRFSCSVVRGGDKNVRPPTIEWKLLDRNNTTSAVFTSRDGAVAWDRHGEAFYEGEMTITNPALWSPDSPNLYTLVTEVRADGKVVEREREEVGIRTVVFTSNEGLLVNGRRVQVKGVCLHHDFAGVGTAIPVAIEDYRLERLKWLGANAVRTAHNPQSEAFMRACDRHGILVMDETRLCASSAEGLSQFGRLILRDRNRPSVIAWSIGNEEHAIQGNWWGGGEPEIGRRIARRMVAYAAELDPERVCTYGGNNGPVHEGINEFTQLRGVNYIRQFQEKKDKDGRSLGVGSAIDDYHTAHPNLPIWASEECSTQSARGKYTTDWSDKDLAYINDLDEPEVNVTAGWTVTAEYALNFYRARPYLIGGFVWTGFDYRGEVGSMGWPSVVSYFGILDLCGFPKNRAYYYRAWWTDEDVINIYPHWNWVGNESNAPTTLYVDTNWDEVELFLNGRSLGRHKVEKYKRLRFPVVYAPGVVEARGTRGGRPLTYRLETTGPTDSLALTASRSRMKADGVDAVVVNITALDANGNEVPTENGCVDFDVKGGAWIIGVGNGDQTSHEKEVCASGQWQRRFHAGKCQVILRAPTTSGESVLSVKLRGAASVESSLTLTADAP